MTWKKYIEKPHAEVRNFGFNFGALLNQQMVVVLQDEAEDEENAKDNLKKRKSRDGRRNGG